MTCLAVCAAMRPKSIGGSGSTTNSPTDLSGNSLAASTLPIWVSSFSTVSTISVQRDRRTSPLLRSIVARMSFSWPYLARPAFWMACSIASSTSSRSMFFSRATASATSSSSGRAIAVSMATSVSGVRLGVQLASGLAGGGFDQGVGQDKLRAANVGVANGDFRTVVEPKPRGLLVGPQNHAGEALAAVLREEGFNPRQMAGEAVPVLDAGQRAVDAGGTDLQRPGAGNRIVDVDRGADVMADLLAILDRDLRAVGAVGHDLHRGTFAAEDRDAHQFESHQFQARRDDARPACPPSWSGPDWSCRCADVVRFRPN